MKKFFSLIIILLTIFSLSSISLSLVSADNGFSEAVNQQTGNKKEATITSVLKQAISLLSYAIGAASVIMIIYGGFKYVTSAGDAGKVGEAKKTITYAVIGVIVAILAYAIVNFVIKLVN